MSWIGFLERSNSFTSRAPSSLARYWLREDWETNSFSAAREMFQLAAAGDQTPQPVRYYNDQSEETVDN